MQKTANISDFEIKWRMPFSMTGFYIIESLKQNGVKGIERKKNYAEIIKGLKNKNA